MGNGRYGPTKDYVVVKAFHSTHPRCPLLTVASFQEGMVGNMEVWYTSSSSLIYIFNAGMVGNMEVWYTSSLIYIYNAFIFLGSRRIEA